MSPSSFVDVLRGQADARPDKVAFIFLENGETEAETLTYAQLDLDARRIAAQLQERAQPGDRALLLYPPGLDFIRAFMGCLYAGVIAVPLYPPRRNRSIERLKAVAGDADAVVALTNAAVARTLAPGEHGDLGVAILVADRDGAGDSSAWRAPAITPATLAFLQYTSGSTGTPKGVMVTHGNLLHNSTLIKTSFAVSADTVNVSWLPVFHDMGLIGIVLQSMFCGAHAVLMEPAAFLQKPARWLGAISRYHGTTSGAPNSAYELCARKVSPEDRATLDLSSWRFAFNGAEPVRASTIRRFHETFAPCGLRLESMQPCYGLAEATLLVSLGGSGQEPVFHTANGSTLVSSGKLWLDERVVIVDPETRERCADGETGEIWIASDSVAAGYWNRPDDTAATFGARIAGDGDGPFLRTGDLGLERDGQLFVAGRLKDLIIVRGRNLYPQDIEQTAGAAHPALSPDLSAAFSISPEGSDEGEQLVVVCEVARERLAKLNAVEALQAVRQAVAEEHEVDPAAIVLLRTLALPRTSSGKVQRRACRDRFLAGTLDVAGEWRRPAEPTTAHGGVRGTVSYAAIRDWLVTTLSAQTGVPAAQIGLVDPFTRYGLDSQRAVILSGELQDWLGRPLPATIAYDYPSIDALARHLSQQSAIRNPQSTIRNEAVAIVGIGCRFPGASTPDQFWTLLVDGVDAIGTAPADRPHGGTLGTGGFVDDVELFDAGFFGVTPREAEMMDPQQRLLLEIAWEAIEHAGIDADRLAGSRTGVFVGISNLDYLRLQQGGPAATDPYAGTGNALSVAANRISYALDLRGPSWAVDTACSSSLVAVHQACESLRRGECDAALSGGVNLILSPDLTMVFTRAGMMSASHRCRTFDAGADGYVRGEGAALVVLKRLTDAVRDGDTIHAVIRGSAVNQDGRSNGLTAPNGPAQQAVIRAALDAAGVEPSRVGYVEAHGTGTPLGDPIEMHALVQVLAGGRTAADRCAVGSVKTNIGHLESAAGIAGLVKAALALKHETIPASLHFRTPNPHLTLEGTPFSIAAAAQPWSRGVVPRIAGVSAFGFGGTNAHVILEEAPAAPAPVSDGRAERPAHVLTLSARSDAALRARAGQLTELLRDNPGVDIADVAFTSNTGRAALSHRAALVVASSADAHERLNTFAATGAAPGIKSARTTSPPAIAFLFTGQGSQSAGMARDLFDTEPVFRRAMLDADERFRRETNTSLLDVIYHDQTRLLDETGYTQPALFAIECALARLWASWGVVPAAVMGHSVGEYAAACVAGVFDAADGMRLIAARATMMQALPRAGSMRVVLADLDVVRAAAAPHSARVSIAAANGPGNTVISGEAAAIDAVVAELANRGVKALALNTSHAFHSALMAPMVPAFRAVAETIAFRAPRIPIISNLTGRMADAGIATADYWCRHILEPVTFGAGMETLSAAGITAFVELGPKPDLIGMGRRIVATPGAIWAASLQKNTAGWDTMLEAAAALFAGGARLDWNGVDAGRGRARVALPSYPFERQRFWIDETSAAAPTHDASHHPLLGSRLPAAAHTPGVHTWESSLSLDRLPYLASHSVLGSVVLPYSAFVEMALAAVGELADSEPHRLTDLHLHHPVVLSATDPARIQVSLDRTATGTWRLRVYNYVHSAWTLSASALLEARTDDEIWPDVLCRE